MKASQHLTFLIPLLLLFLSFTGNTQDTQNPQNNLCTDPFQPVGFEQIINGDFTEGIAAFGTDFFQTPECIPNSIWVFNSNDANCTGELVPDHTAPDGNYLSVTSQVMNGQYQEIIWEQDLFLLADQEYIFSYWVNNRSQDSFQEGPFLVVDINNMARNEAFISVDPIFFGQWTQVCFSFQVPESGQYRFAIRQAYPTVVGDSPPSFFLLDDISLRAMYEDAVYGEVMVEYAEGTSEQQKAALREEFGVPESNVNTCVCGDVDAWLIAQLPIIIDGQLILTIEDLREKSEDKAEVQSSNYNYYVQAHGNNDNITRQVALNQDDVVVPEALAADSCDIVVAVIDTGVDYNHMDLAACMWQADYPCACPPEAIKGYDFVNDDTDPFDDNGHGTHVAGIIKSEYNDYNLNEDFKVKIMPVKALNESGQGTVFDIICATLYAIENGADVINMSFGYRGDSSQVLYNAIDYARTFNEILVIASVGNDTTDNNLYPHYPSNHGNVNLIAVAADTIDGNNNRRLTDYSCYGNLNVDISAYGTMTSTWPGNAYFTLSGTSMAAPQVAAAAAWARPNFSTAADLKNMILASGMPLVTPPNIVTDLSFEPLILQENLMGDVINCNATDKEVNYWVSNTDIEVLSNPTANTVTIAGDFSNADIEILDAGGTLVYSYLDASGPFTVDLSCLSTSGTATGYYLVIRSKLHPDLWTWLNLN